MTSQDLTAPGSAANENSQFPEGGDDQPNDPAEGPRSDDAKDKPSKIPSTHVPDNREFDL